VLAATQIAGVAGVAVTGSTDGVAAVLGALVLAPVAVWAVAAAGSRVAGPRFGLAAAIVFVLLPHVARAYFYGAYDKVYADDVLPNLVGLRATWTYALGVAAAIAFRFAPRAFVAAAGVVAAATALAVWGTGSLGGVKANLHETGWSPALLEWLPVAGAVGAARKAPLLAVGLFGWLLFAVLRAADASYANGAFWRDLAPALPAAALLLTGVALLVPRVRLDAR
jgi:hypothetical protein